MLMKQCSQCRGVLPVDQFSPNPDQADGFSYQCRACAAELSRQSYQRRRDAVLAQQRAYRLRRRQEAGAG